MLKTNAVWTVIDRKRDGLRILDARFRGRGMPKSRYGIWIPSLGPSECLLRHVQAGTDSWVVSLESAGTPTADLKQLWITGRAKVAQ